MCSIVTGRKNLDMQALKAKLKFFLDTFSFKKKYLLLSPMRRQRISPPFRVCQPRVPQPRRASL